MGKHFTEKVLCSFLVFLLGGHLIFADVIYVDIDATGANDGSSWGDAFTYLADALDTALSGDEIRVAQGIYYPDCNMANPSGSGDRDASFQLLDGIIVKGGYAGNGESYPHFRDIKLFRTILSGNIGDGSVSDNSRHIVTGADNSVIDGFIIKEAYGSGTAMESYGGGMLNYQKTNVVVSNCMFYYNWARFGGAIYNAESQIELINCLFHYNSAGYNGGAVRDNASTILVENCTFTYNEANTEGAGGYTGGGMNELNSDTTIISSIFWDNIGDGGVDELAQIKSSGGTLAVSYSCIQDLDTLSGNGNIDADPCFVPIPGGFDPHLHLQSQAGNWYAYSQSWGIASVTSPCIDAGDPACPIGYEPFPNGGRINMGTYGGTEKASKSYFGTTPCQSIMAGDINGDCSIDLLDFVIIAGHWLWQERFWLASNGTEITPKMD